MMYSISDMIHLDYSHRPPLFFLFKNDTNCILYFEFANLRVLRNLLWRVCGGTKVFYFGGEMLDLGYANTNIWKSPFYVLKWDEDS